MQFSLESLAALATIIGTVVGLLALLQARAWLVLTSLFFVCLAIGSGLYARRDRRALIAASTVIEGHSIDSLNIANLRRRVSRTLFIQEADHTARIEGKDLEITWKYSGYCRADRETAMEFSIDSGARTSFEEMDCVAYDLGHDPKMGHKIRPLLIGTEGVSKKISVPFLQPVKANESFSMLLTCTLHGCMKAGFDCYTATLSFAQDRVRRCVVHLIFVGPSPKWVRVYESTSSGQTVLLKELAPSSQNEGLSEYVEIVEDRPGQSARMYAFWRDG